MKNTTAFLLLSLISILTACTTSAPIMNNTPTGQSPVSLAEIYKPYSYAATVVDVYDGDTFTLDFEIGFGLTFREKIRLARVDTPEIRGKEKEEGIKVKAWVESQILNQKVVASTYKDKRGSFGRVLIEVYYLNASCACYVNLNSELLEREMAEVWTRWVKELDTMSK